MMFKTSSIILLLGTAVFGLIHAAASPQMRSEDDTPVLMSGTGKSAQGDKQCQEQS
jgi:hypothetical protein